MDQRPLGIDHVIVGVRDLEAARAQWTRLGFTATPRGRHAGWGTANHCLMFDSDYVELLGIVDPRQFSNQLEDFLAEREGLLSVSFGTPDPDATAAAWTASGLGPAEPRALGRSLELPGGDVELRFRNVLLPRQSMSGLRLFASHHLTPELLRQPGWTEHPNGALALVSCTIVAPDPAALAEGMARALGSSAVTQAGALTVVQTGTAVILIADAAEAATLHPGFSIETPGTEPLLEVVAIMVEDPDRAAAHLARQAIPCSRDRNGAVLVQPEHATGVRLELVPG